MSTCEVLHERFVNTSTAGLTLLSILDPSVEDNPLEFIHKIVDIYHEKVQENIADDKLHDAFRTLLCYQYQLQVENKMEVTSYYSNRSLFEHLRESLLGCGDNNESTQAILNDITVLQIVFYLNNDDINELFIEALEFIEKRVNEANNLQNYLPIIETLVDAWSLRRKFQIDDISSDVMTIGLLLDKISCWFEIIDENNSQEWRPFISLLIKLTNATAFPEALCNFLWDSIAGYKVEQTEKKSLTLLCGLVEDFFSKSSEEILSMNINYCLNEKVLLLISHHLSSNVTLCRKQAQYVLKKIVEYLNEHTQDIPNKGANEQLTPPFIFCNDGNFDFKEIQSNYFMLLANLEEKQAHLVLPAMNHLDNLVDASIFQESLVHRTWVRCIVTRLLKHENNTVIKAGLTALLRMDMQIFDDEFIKLLIQTLNYTFLYEDLSSDPHPRVLKELSKLLIKAEQSEINFTSKFIIAASKINWSSIPLFYVFEALGNNKKMTQVKHNIWAAEELEALRVITHKYVRQQIEIMRVPTQKNILKCITIYVKSPLDFLLLGRIFSSIASDEVLKRGNDSWKLLTKYLKKNIDESNAVKSISKSCEQLLKSQTDSTDINALAILIILMCDTGNMLFKASITSNSLCQLFMPIIDMYKRPYADSSLFLKALEMINCLMKLSPQANDTHIVFIFGFLQSIFDLIINSLRLNWPLLYEAAIIHVKALSAILNIRDLSPNFAKSIINMMNIGDEEFEKITELISHNETSVIRAWYALNIVYLSNDKSCDAIFYKDPPKFTANESNGNIISECYGLVAKIYHHCIKRHEKLPGEFFKQFLTAKLMVLAKTKSNHAIAVITATLREIITKFKDDGEMINDCSGIINDIIDVCWSNLWDMNRSKEFSTAAKEFIKLILNEDFIKVKDFEKIALNKVHDIISNTDYTSALRYILFTQMKSLKPENIFIFCDSILSTFLQTDVRSTNEKIEMQTCCYITKQHEINFLNESLISGLGIYTDVVTRAVLVILILAMDVECGEKLLKAYITQLTSMLEKVKNKKYFQDSNIHRLKHRIMQIFLLIHYIDGEDVALKLHDTLSDLILFENDEPSVQIMKELNLMIMYEDGPMRNFVWNLFSSAHENQPDSLKSLISIVYHVANTLLPCQQLEYIKKAVVNILPCCFNQKFIVRLYSQVVLSKLLEILDKISPEQSNEYKIISKAVQESLQHGNLKTTSTKLLDNFYFSIFNLCNNYSLQSIFHELPRLTNMPMDEWIRPEIFASLATTEPDIFEYISLYDNAESDLSAAETPLLLDEFDRIPDSDLSQNEDAQADIQEKMIGSTLILSNNNEFVPMPMTLRQKLITNDTGLIVIASLIEGFLNLRGLARTAEIFGVREFILQSKTYTVYKNFESLSVKSDKWITISEVKPHELRNYLMEKKSMGWSLVGAEQIVNSVNLCDMKFNEKTILLLGNEKNGIPANLIQLLDTCVKIPQAGVISSLNVHVTGAICMWQYAQQHFFQRL